MFSLWHKSRHKKTDDAYVSEFTDFMNHFLEEHPKTLADQHTGWYLYWDKKVDLEALDKAERDSVPDDRYGFDYSAWHKAAGTPREKH